MSTATTRRVMRSVGTRSTRPGRRTSTTKLRAVKNTPTELLPVGPPSSSAPLPDRYLLTVLRGDPLGRVIRAGVEDVVIGRGGSANFVLADPGLSWIHARVFRQGEALFIEDLGSTNGTFRPHHPEAQHCRRARGRVGAAALRVHGPRFADVGPQSPILRGAAGGGALLRRTPRGYSRAVPGGRGSLQVRERPPRPPRG